MLLLSALLPAAAAATAATPAVPQPKIAQQALDCRPPAAEDARWDGLSVMAGGKGYVDTPMGQVHYRLLGPEKGPVLLLLHETPWSSIEWAYIQPCLSRLGIRSLAIDTPGYGLSDAPAGAPSIAQYADNIVPVLDRLRIRSVAVAGHHTGAAIAAALAARHPSRVNGLILHGAPNYNDAERAQRRALPHPDLTPKPDGSHLSGYFNRLYRAQGTVPRHLNTITWSTLNIFLAGAADVAHAAVYGNDMAGDLSHVKVPVLVLSDAKDALNPIDQRTGRTGPNFRYQLFSNGSAHGLLVEPKRWSDIAGGFVNALPRPQ